MQSIKIAIADDHTLVRSALIATIQSQILVDVIAEGENGKELLLAIEQSNQIPDIAIVDLSMPVMNGYETIPHLQKLYPSTKILILSFVIEPNALQHLFNVGIHGFINKSDSKFNFESALRQILETGFFKNQHYLPQQKEPLNWKKNEFHGSIPLTHAEMTFIKYRVNGYQIKEIAETLFVSSKTIENYRNSIYKKLEINSTEEIIEYGKSIGLEKWNE